MRDSFMTIHVYEELTKNGMSGNLSGETSPTQLQTLIKDSLEKFQVVSIDLKSIQSISPSFAYETFGKLVDFFGAKVEDRLRFENDPLNFQKRIFEAIRRRAQVIN